jgi:hypothetical protein
MNEQQFNDLINKASQGYNPNDPFSRETFRLDLQEGISRGIRDTWGYDQKFAYARDKWRMLWQTIVLFSFIWLGSKVWDFVAPYWNTINSATQDQIVATGGEYLKFAVVAVALIYGFVKIAKFVGGLFHR